MAIIKNVNKNRLSKRVNQREVLPDVIKNRHVQNLSATNVTTGTLNVSDGTDDAKISVKDASGNEVVLLDSNGITINSGKITLNDENETTIIDSAGVVSTAVFGSGSATKTSNQTIDSTSFADVTSLSVTFTASSDRTVKVLFTATVTGYYWGSIDGVLIMKFVLDGTTDIGPVFLIPSHFDETIEQTVSAQFIYSLPSGSHTVKIQAKVNNSSESAVIASTYSDAVLTYVVLGD